MPVAITSVASNEVPRGQLKKQEPVEQTPSATQPPPSSTAPAGETNTPSSQPSPPGGTATPAPATASPAAGASPATPSPSYSGSLQLSLMAPRLRDLIVEQRSTSLDKTSLTLFADQMAAERLSSNAAILGGEEQVQKTREEILANASQALLAQANHSRESVLALLEAA